MASETDAAAAADTVPSASAAPLMASAAPSSKSTAVDGQGMWRSWTRVFSKPESACLDLLDNCFDAALKMGFKGRVEMSSSSNHNHAASGDSPTPPSSQSIVTIQNNSEHPIKSLEAALTVYKSSKNFDNNNSNQEKDKDAIGENGVGLKHGCATLSDCSIVLTRNQETVEIGIIAKKLQTSHGVCLPSFTFQIPNSSELRTVIKRWLEMNPEILHVLQESFGPPSMDVEAQVTQFAEYLYKNDWDKQDHVFLLVLCNLKTSADVPHDLIESVSPAKLFLKNIKTMLPEHYINLPAQGMFEFDIDGETIDFSFWQHRLVELTKFQVHISTTTPFENLPDADWDKPSPDKYPLSIYCGFDAQRLDRFVRSKQGTSNCILYIHSCEAGRLIKKEIDARHMLGLGSSGVDYTQGLTIIINDVAGKLPLTPTKDGIAWSEQPNGEIHQKNLMSWAGGVAHFFWTQRKNTFGGKGTRAKETMKNTIASFVQDQRANTSTVTENMESANFNRFPSVEWKRVTKTFENRWTIRKTFTPQPAACLIGPDSLFQFKGREKPTAKRKSTTDPNTPPRKRALNNDDGNANMEIEHRTSALPLPELDVNPWDEVEEKDIRRVSLGVLSYFREKDKDDVFEIPVWEAFPEVTKVAYMLCVPNPMDFSRIENERIPTYKSIKELQEDLILVFQNCLRYNNPSSLYAKLARTMLDSLDDAIESTDIKQITMRVLSYVRSLDERELFELPVVEQCPDLKETYPRVIPTPMDFRTIEEERMDTYTSKEDLLQDLTLIFQNCITFNSKNSPADGMYRAIARKMLEMLKTDFDDLVLGKLGIGKKKRKRLLNYAQIEDQYMNMETNSPKRRPSSNADLKKQLHETEKRLKDSENQARRLTQQCAEQVRFVEERRAQQVQDLESQLKGRDLRIMQLEARPPPSPSKPQETLERQVLNRDGRIRFLEQRESTLEQQVQDLKAQLAERDQRIENLKGGRPEAENVAKDSSVQPKENTEVSVFGGIPRTVSAPPGSLGIMIAVSPNGLEVSKMEDDSPLNGKLSLGDIIFAICNVDTRSMSLEEIQSLVANTADQERTMSVITPSKCFLEEASCSEALYRKKRGLPVQPLIPELSQTQDRTAAASNVSDPNTQHRSTSDQPQAENQPESHAGPSSDDFDQDMLDTALDLESLLQDRSNKLAEEDKIRVRQFIVGVNPTPDQPIYKMKTHEQRGVDPETGEAIKETFYLELNYHDFTKTESKKVKRY